MEALGGWDGGCIKWEPPDIDTVPETSSGILQLPRRVLLEPSLISSGALLLRAEFLPEGSLLADSGGAVKGVGVSLNKEADREPPDADMFRLPLMLRLPN